MSVTEDMQDESAQVEAQSDTLGATTARRVLLV